MEQRPETGETMVFRRSDYDDGNLHLLPDDLRARCPAVRLVRMVEEAAGRLPESVVPNAEARRLAAVILWCLLTGRYGSWDIEALCAEEPLCHHLAGDIQPTHSDIHRFRREHEASLASSLTELLGFIVPAGDPAALRTESSRRLDRARLADSEGPG